MPRTLSGILYCPKCKSTNVDVSDGGRGFSILKGLFGGCLLGLFGFLFGF